MLFERNSSYKNERKDRKIAYFGFLLLMQPVSNACAGALAYGIGYLTEYSDNIGRVPTDPTVDWANSVVAAIGYQESSPEILARVRVQAQYRDYKNDTYENEAIYYVDAAAIWSILPQSLTWSVYDRADQVTLDVTRADTPDNRTTVNFFSTGPDAYFHLDHVHTLALGARYGNVKYNYNDSANGSTTNDNNRYGAHARWNYLASKEHVYSLNYLYEQVEYADTTQNDNYVRHDAFVRADWRRNLSQFVVDAGTTKIVQEQGPGDEGPSLRLTWNQRLNSESTASVLLGKQFLDPGGALLATTTEPGQSATLPLPQPITASTGVVDFYFTNSAEIAFRRASSSLLVEARAFYRDIDYQALSVSSDRDENGFRVDLAYNPGSTFIPGVFFYNTNSNFQANPIPPTSARSDTLSDVGVRFLYRSTRQLSTNFEYRRSQQTSSDASKEYTENSVFLSFTYSTNAEIAQVTPRQR